MTDALSALSAASRCESGDDFCRNVYDVTGNAWLAASANWLIARPAHILVIIIVAVVLRLMLFRGINRMTRVTAAGTVPAALRPLKDRAAGRLIENSALLSERRAQRAKTIGSVLRSIVSAVVFTIAVILVLGELGIDLAPLIAGAGIVGVAIGFGAQNLVKDFLSGMFMILEDQYGVGDVIDAGEAIGVVEAVGLRSTRVRDVGGTVWYIRNGEIVRVGNKSQGWMRALIDVPVAYSADLVRARAVIQSSAEEISADARYAGLVLDEPEVWGVQDMTAEGLTIRVIVKTAPGQQDTVARALRERIKARFDEEGISVPFPTGAVIVQTESGTGAG